MGNKICFTSTVSSTAKCFILPIARAVAETGADVTLVCSEDPAMPALCEQNGVRYHPVHMGRGIDFSGLRVIRELKKLYKSEKFDLVQYCTPNASFYASRAAKSARVPVRLYCQWGIRYVGMDGFSRKLFRALERSVCKKSTHIRTVSKKNLEFAVSEGLYKESEAKVIGNGGTIGVDLSVFDITKKSALRAELESEYGLPADGFVFGFCGRLSRDKGSNELLTAFRKISEERADAALFVIGDIESNTGIDEELMEWAKASDRVRFTGKVPESEVSRMYPAMDVLIHPTYREGFGMVIQEAGAMGIPCVTTDIPGASEVMEDGKSCILVPAKDTDALKDAMLRVCSDRALCEELGRTAYERTAELYDRRIMLKNQKEDYIELLGGKTMRVILSDRKITGVDLPNDAEIKTVDLKTLSGFNGSPDVIAVAGSRAMARAVKGMDLPSLRLYQLTSAGFDNVPCAEFRERGVDVCNAGSVYSVPIAETVVLGVLLMAKRLRKNPNNRRFKFTRHYTSITELAGKKALIMGTGNIGTAIADRLLGFGVATDGYDVFDSGKSQYGKILIGREALLEHIGEYDFVACTLPDNEQTHGFFNKELLDRMSPDAVILNVGRNAVFNRDDLYSALRSRKINGAVLDIFEKFPNPITNKFRRLSNVIVMPGVAAISREVGGRLNDHITANLNALLSGGDLKCVINK